MEKRNLTKLLPAAAVLTAVTITGLKIQAEDQKSVSSSENIMNSEELGNLLLAAYPAEEETSVKEKTEVSSQKTENSSKKTEKKTTKTTKKKTSGIKKGSKKTLPQKTAASSGVGQGSTSTPVAEVPESGYKDGTYQGSGTGFGGTISVQVTVSGGKISNIDILSAAGETGSYFSAASGVVSRILSAQNPNVDAVSGATYSSNGIIQAVQNALSGAANTTKNPTPTPKPSKKPSKTNGSTKVSYKDGIYEGQAEGFDGPVNVKITIKNGKIKKITNTNTDTAEFFSKAWKTLKVQILEQQSADGLDAVSGATYSSNGILGATKAALSKAGAENTSGTTTTPAPTKAPAQDQTPTPTPVQTPQIPSDGGSTDNNQSLRDGVYTASAEGFSGLVTITLTVKDGVITDITNTNSDTKSFFKRAWSLIQPEILQSQTADEIDGVSGATYSSNGILNAAKAAIAQARNNGETPQPTQAPQPTEVPQPTSTPVPTETPKPTEVPQPTETPEPTAAPEPTEIPEPTAAPKPTVPPDPVTRFYDGTYTGSGTGNDGPGSVRVTVTISGGKITNATYDTDDDEDFFIDAWDGILGQIMGKQSAEGIDTVSGSTYSSKGIIQAFQSALQQAKGA